jgi:hypothetical protein
MAITADALNGKGRQIVEEGSAAYSRDVLGAPRAGAVLVRPTIPWSIGQNARGALADDALRLGAGAFLVR